MNVTHDNGNVIVSFFCPGQPRPQGSKMAPFKTKGGKWISPEANANVKRWRKCVAECARFAMGSLAVRDGDVSLEARFLFERPKSHYAKSGALTKSSPESPGHNLGDLSKLVRAVEDAMSEIVYKDDAMIQRLRASKCYADADVYEDPGVHISVWWTE